MDRRHHEPDSTMVGLPQITEAFPWDTAPTFLILDNDCAYGEVFAAGLVDGHSRPPYRASIAMAERICRARNRLDPT